LFPIEVAIVVAKLGSSPRAAANSFNVSSVVGAVSTRFAICVDTYPEILVVYVPPSFFVNVIKPVVLFVVPPVVYVSVLTTVSVAVVIPVI